MDTTGPLPSKVSKAHKFGLGTGQRPERNQMGIEKVQGQVNQWMTRVRLTLESRSEYRGSQGERGLFAKDLGYG